ncbi:MAG: GGDEF domain-containing protein [Gammaproteobacteria bacterium]|nr:GGDEF domain-containing protein [Gammaproteobacteria bacterium]
MEKNPYSDDYAKASGYLRLTLVLLSKPGIPPSPLNIQIGYDHVSGRNEALKTALSELLEQPEGASEENLWALYKHFFVQDDQALEEMRQELRRIIINLQGEFENSGGNLSSYATTLSHFASILAPSTPPGVMSTKVETVIEDTRSMEQSQHRLELQLAGILTDVESLRKELEEVKEESLTDSLTGISNRRAFDSALEQAIHIAREQKSKFCILLADIDHFKKFNDAHGHLVGDKVLRFVAATIKRCVKGKDIAARFGGEEFAVILPQTGLSGAVSVAEQIRKAISSGELKNKAKGGTYGKVTISIGVAQFYASNRPNDLIQRADRALYLAKNRGRNRVEKAT